MYRTKLHIGFRTFKTALAVTLALLIAHFMNSNMPIFSAIGAISAMSRTLGDSITACKNQLIGTVCGCCIGYLFAIVFPVMLSPIIGIGIIIVILIGNKLKIYLSIPLSCIVFVGICLYDAGTPLSYALSRFFDTSIGLVVALVINLFIKPYNNRRRISNMLIHFVQALPEYIDERVINLHYPDLTHLEHSLKMLDIEIELFEKQKFPVNPIRQEVSVYLRGCKQLAQRIYDELNAICLMDSTGFISKEYYEIMKSYHLCTKEPENFCDENKTESDIVLCYHVKNIIDAYDYLQTMNQAPDEEIIEDLPVYHQKNK